MNRYMLIHRLMGPAILLLLGIIALLHQAPHRLVGSHQQGVLAARGIEPLDHAALAARQE